MKALLRSENGVLSFENIPEPQIVKPTDVKIKVMYSTIGIQDLRMNRAWDFYAKPGIAGYEMSGIIVDLGSRAKEQGFSIGERVTGTVAQFCGSCIYCQKGEEHNCISASVHSGTICEYIIWNSSQLLALPPSLPYSIGCLTEPVAVVSMAAQKLHIRPGDNICIFGGDFNGLLMVQLARQAGADKIVVVEPKESNQTLALSLGATHVIDPSEDTYETTLFKLSDFIGFQDVVIMSSNPDWLNTATMIAARGATILVTVYFDHEIKIAINSIKFFAMNLNITSSFLYTKKVLSQTPLLMSSLKLKELITKEYSVKDSIRAFEDEQLNKYPRLGLIMDF